MADVRPFRALRYDERRAGPLSRLVCPPYDLIDDAQQRALYDRSPYNAVRIEYAMASPRDTPGDNRYTRSANTYRAWREARFLVRDERPAYYVLRDTFTHRGKRTSRTGVIAAVRLEEFDKGVVLPHEHTHEGPKQDRLALMQSCQANFSPLMMLYHDPARAVRNALNAVTSKPPATSAEDDAGTRHELWLMQDPALVRAVAEAFRSQPLYVADGHHRYETALYYRDQVRRQAGAWTGEEAWNFVMLDLLEFEDPGLLVLPYHRMLHDLTPPQLSRTVDQVRDAFEIERFPGGRSEGWLERLLDTVAERGRKDRVLSMLGQDGEGPYLLRYRGKADLSVHGPVAQFEAWLLEHLALRPAIGDAVMQKVEYTHDAEEAVREVLGGRANAAFFLKPFDLGLLEAIVKQGRRLPPKSTYFWPKVPTGVVFNALEEVV